MRAVDIIEKKRDGQALTRDEILWFIDAYTRDILPDYQAAALLMAICIRGMDDDEVTALTLAMAESGDTLDLSDIASYIVDKHSSGGVGDKTSLVVLPLVASCGVPVAKMSGRGLGFTGGTLDKMESIAGFKVNLGEAVFRAQAREIGLALVGQSHDLAPADGKLYALRDVTGTVPSIPLIASSIMSKKLAAGANGIVLDVKVGTGAFMTNLDEARALARTMVAIGRNAGRDMVALISDMNQPLGEAVGHTVEVVEAIETLNGGGPADLRVHCLEVAGQMLRLAGQGDRWIDTDETCALLAEKLANGAALKTFRQMVEAQGGDTRIVDDPSLMPQATQNGTFKASESGYLARIDALGIARAALELGAGREKKDDLIDHAVGLLVHVKVGNSVEAGTPLVTILANDSARMERAARQVMNAITISQEPVEPLTLVHDIIRD